MATIGTTKIPSIYRYTSHPLFPTDKTQQPPMLRVYDISEEIMDETDPMTFPPQ
jgi:hypothetical protein